MMLLVVVTAASIFAALLTRGGTSRRVPAALIPVAIWMLVTQPRVPWPGIPGVSLAADASLADIEAVLEATPEGAVIEVSGDGLHPELLPLLGRRVLRWRPPAAPLGLAALSWPRRVAVGEPVQVSGRVDVADSVLVKLVSAEGTIDSLRTNSTFAFSVVARAPGRWAMQLSVGRDTTTLGFQAVLPPHLRVLVIAGRPDFEVPALVRRLAAQGADLTVRTQLTRDRRRIERLGITPLDPQLSTAMLDSLDLVVLAAGGAATLVPPEQRLLAAAVERGLGLLHLTDAPLAVGPLTPFALQASGTEWSARLSLEARVWPGVVRVAPLTGSDTLAFLHDSSGKALAWRSSHGLGMVAATTMVQAHRLPLSGNPETEAAWWSALLGPVLRAPRGRWLVADDALVVADQPIKLEWLGVPPAQAEVREGGSQLSRVGLLQGDSGQSASLRLWPSNTGWMAVIGDADTLELFVARSGSFPGVAASQRRATMVAVAREAAGTPPTGRVPLPRAVGWLVLVMAVAATWRPR